MENGGIWQKFMGVLSQAPLVGGLEISPTILRFFLKRGKDIVSSSVKLPQGVIERGKINNLDQFKEALRTLRKNISGTYGKGEKVNVIASFPFSKTYLQVFQLPVLPEKKIKEALKLNMQMVSPIPINTAYYDWEKINKEEGEKKIEQEDYLGVFAPMNESDVFLNVLAEEGFNALAVEFSTLALARFFKDNSHGFDLNKSYLLLNVSDEGMDFLITRNGFLNFDYFVSWKSIRGNEKSVSWGALEGSLSRSLQQMLNFFSGKWKGRPDSLVLSADSKIYPVIEKVSKSFGLNVVPFRPTDYYNIDRSWLVTLGLALRGMVSRSKDNFITLTNIDTEERYFFDQIVTFSRFWRNMVVIILGFFIFVFFSSNLFLGGALDKMEQGVVGSSQGNQSQILAEVNKLRDEAGEFNILVSAVKESKSERENWSSFFEKVYILAGNEIEITRIFFQSDSVPIVLSGKSKDVEAILSFRDRVMKEKIFEEVNLPLSNVSQVGRDVLFNLSFSFNKSAVE